MIRAATTHSKPTTRNVATSNPTRGSKPSISRMFMNSTTTSRTISNRPILAKTLVRVIAKIRAKIRDKFLTKIIAKTSVRR